MVAKETVRCQRTNMHVSTVTTRSRHPQISTTTLSSSLTRTHIQDHDRQNDAHQYDACLSIGVSLCMHWAPGRSHVGTMSKSWCRRHDGPALLLTTAQAGQSTPSNPDRDTKGDIGVGADTITLEVCVAQFVETWAGRYYDKDCRFFFTAEFWKPRMTRLRWELRAGVAQVMSECQYDKNFERQESEPRRRDTMLEEEVPRNS